VNDSTKNGLSSSTILAIAITIPVGIVFLVFIGLVISGHCRCSRHRVQDPANNTEMALSPNDTIHYQGMMTSPPMSPEAIPIHVEATTV
jgi:hypothetical protein